MIEIIVTDLGKVLLPFDTGPPMARLRAAAPECDHLRSVFQRLWAEADLGKGASDPKEFHRKLAAETGLRLSYEEFCRDWSDMFEEDGATIGLIMHAPVRERHVLSNTNAIHWDWILSRHGEMLGKFDRCWVSHEMRLEKPDPEIYRQVIAATGLPPAQHVFIDDIAENVRAAEAVGMAGIVHTDATSLAPALKAIGLSVPD